MTCIVGIAHEGKVYMGSERGAGASGVIVSTLQSKVSINHDFLVGYSGSGFGVGQLATLAEYPADGENLELTLRTIFCKSMSRLINKYGGVENGSHDLLLGGYGRLFEVYTDDWGIIEISESAVGSGDSYALGSLYTTGIAIDELPPYTPDMRILLALQAAITYSPTCQGPIDMFSI
jgi:hypothetical protein